MRVFRTKIKDPVKLRSLLSRIELLFGKKKSSLMFDVAGKLFHGKQIENLEIGEDRLTAKTADTTLSIGFSDIRSIRKLRPRRYCIVTRTLGENNNQPLPKVGGQDVEQEDQEQPANETQELSQTESENSETGQTHDHSSETGFEH